MTSRPVGIYGTVTSGGQITSFEFPLEEVRKSEVKLQNPFVEGVTIPSNELKETLRDLASTFALVQAETDRVLTIAVDAARASGANKPAQQKNNSKQGRRKRGRDGENDDDEENPMEDAEGDEGKNGNGDEGSSTSSSSSSASQANSNATDSVESLSAAAAAAANADLKKARTE